MTLEVAMFEFNFFVEIQRYYSYARTYTFIRSGLYKPVMCTLACPKPGACNSIIYQFDILIAPTNCPNPVQSIRRDQNKLSRRASAVFYQSCFISGATKFFDG